MHIRLVDHNARRLELDHPDEHGRSRILEIEYLTRVSGEIERDPPTAELHPLSVGECQVSGLDWHLRQGHISIGTPATLAGLVLHGRYTSDPSARWPFEGELSWSSLDAERVRVERPDRRVSLDLRADNASVALSTEEGGHASVAKLALANLQTAIGGALVRVSRAAGTSTRLDWGGAMARLEAATAAIRGLAIQERDFEIELDQVELPRGIAILGDRIEAREVVVGRARLVIHDVHSLATRLPADSSWIRSLDPALLDGLHGKLDVDLTVDAIMPVIGQRRATHHFRIPIEHGTINFRELERDLARLEDAVIDFEVRNGNLVLERDVPLLPGLHKPLVVWPLNEVERGLARKKIVRLRTLLGYRRPESSTPSAEEKPRVSFRSLSLDDIGIAVALLGPEEGGPPRAEAAGPIPRATLDDLRVMGFLRHRFAGPQDAGAVTLTGGGLDARVRDLRLGGARLDAATARVDAIEDATLAFEGLRPRRLTATIRGLRLTDARLTLVD